MVELIVRSLTLRELEILSLVATGASAKEIARSLNIASRTVEAHISNLKLKTNAKNRAHLVALSLELGLILNPCHDDTDGSSDKITKVATANGLWRGPL
jgi:LuxR family transcriptional regulator of spore coat protein